MNLSTLLRPARRILTATAVTAVAATALASGGTTARTAPVSMVGVSAYPAISSASYQTKVLAGINRVRARHHLRPVHLASCAENVATRWSDHMAAADVFAHQSMKRLLRTCHARYVGEVLGRGSISPDTLVTMWMHSPPHRHILMSKQPRRIGIGATPNARGEWVVAANFMRF
jgi:uncharacterized protein YkwD